MKKTAIIILSLTVVAAFSGCIKDADKSNPLFLGADKVKESVKGWRVYTNPAFLYELRHPTSWRMETSGEDGKLVQFFVSKQSAAKALVIQGIPNWQKKLSLEQYYTTQEEDLFKAGYERGEVSVAGETAIWFKAVKRGDLPINVVALANEERILIFELWTDWEQSLVVLNSVKFYPNKAFDEVK
jgi:hypothetical protein